MATDFYTILEDCIDEKGTVIPDKFEELASKFHTKEELLACLNEHLSIIKQEVDNSKEKATECDQRISLFTNSKQYWKAKAETIVNCIGYLIEKFNLKSYNVNGVKLSSSTRAVLEADPNVVMKDFELVIENCRQMLPPYIKLTASLDKTALKECLKTDNTLLCQYPESIHWTSKTSFSLK